MSVAVSPTTNRTGTRRLPQVVTIAVVVAIAALALLVGAWFAVTPSGTPVSPPVPAAAEPAPPDPCAVTRVVAAAC